MINVVVVAPFFGASMGHCLRCFRALEGVRLGVISQQPADELPPDLRHALDGHYQIGDALDAGQIAVGARAFIKQWGQLDRLEGYLEQLQVPLGEARDALGIDGVSGAVARRFRDKHLMKQTLREAGLPVARQARITSHADLRRFIDQVGYPVVVKPVDGAGAKATARVSNEGEIGAALNQLMPSAANPAQAEEFVFGDEHSFETVVLNGKAVWSSSTFYLPGPLAVLENSWMQYCILLPREVSQPHVERFRPVNHAALSALGLRNGFSHMEWFDRPAGPVVSEVGARPPGANIMLMNGAAHDVDMWAEWTRLQVFRTWRSPERTHAAGCAFLRGQGRGGRIKALHGVEAVQERFGKIVVQAKLPSVGQPHSTHYEGDGWAVVRHEETRVVIEALRALVSEIRIELG